MPKHAFLVTNAVIKFGADIATAISYECQVTTAQITSTPNLVTIPATGCEGQTQLPASSSFALTLGWLQDWGQTDSLSQFLWDNDTEEVQFSIALDTDPLFPVATGTVRVVAGSYGGDFAQPQASTATLPCQGKPVIGPAAASALAARQPAASSAS